MSYRDSINFETNIAPWDRVARVVLGIVLVSLVFVGPQTAYGWIGLGPICTGLFGTCPVYRVLGLSTYKPPKPTARTESEPQE